MVFRISAGIFGQLPYPKSRGQNHCQWNGIWGPMGIHTVGVTSSIYILSIRFANLGPPFFLCMGDGLGDGSHGLWS